MARDFITLIENAGLRIRRALRGSDFVFLAQKIHNAVAVPYDFIQRRLRRWRRPK
jgi:hypothetical protein